MNATKYNVTVQLSGRDGNAFAIMAAVSKALRQAGVSEEEINQYQDESMSGNYENLLLVAAQWVNIK